MNVCVIGFDLSWSHRTGWAVIIANDRIGEKVVATGEFGPGRPKGKVDLSVHVARAVTLVKGIGTVFAIAGPHVSAADRTVVCFEDMNWLVGAARSGRGVTKKSLFAQVWPISILMMSIGLWTEARGFEVEVQEVNVQSARSKKSGLAIDEWNKLDGGGQIRNQLRDRKRWLEVKKGSKAELKLSVGVAVRLLLNESGNEDVDVPSEHVADALLAGLYVLRQKRIELKTE